MLGMWMARGKSTVATNGTAVVNTSKARTIQLVSPWVVATGEPSSLKSLKGKRPMAQVVAMAIKLLKKLLEDYGGNCGEVIEIRTNVGEFATYIQKQCYPKGLNRQSFADSIAIHRLLERNEGGKELGARELKSYFVY